MTEQELHESRIYHFARDCWRRRDELTPSGRQGAKSKRGRPKTWGDRFEEVTGTTLDEYAAAHAR